MKQNIIKITKYKLALVALLVALVGMLQMASPGAFALAQIAPAQDTELKSAVAAKGALADMEPRSFVNIKDERMRIAIQRSYNALKAVGDNTSRTREPALIADFDRTIKDLKSLPQPAGANFEACDNAYETCMEICKETGGCHLCGIGQNGCYLNRLAVEATKNPNLP